MDWTEIIVTLIGLLVTVVTTIGGHLIKKYVIPWLAQRNLTEAAEVVVNAVEAILGRHMGEEKWNMALEKLQALGWDVNEEAVIDALKAAWEKLNINQIAAGIKEAE